jgi:hypothetical protein
MISDDQVAQMGWIDNGFDPDAGGPLPPVPADQLPYVPGRLGFTAPHVTIYSVPANKGDMYGVRQFPASGGPVTGPVNLTDLALDQIEARSFKAAQRAEDE